MVYILEFSSLLHLYTEIKAVTAVSLWNNDSGHDIRSRAKQGKIIQNIPGFVIIAVYLKWQQLFHWVKRIFLFLTKVIK